ncbi:hypothetical protein TI39_contig5844g00001 [Zymoseptoria brevis]|uniref:non-specific serine/threonine protein kinase n=1 Tax=Zymoseptoria brevis TaxID=1047168 RepID=A0A0F4G644_9PEZI|nr:hypothetical protein TI39_contig5844g00001 [Zymoseptoria brevis]
MPWVNARHFGFDDRDATPGDQQRGRPFMCAPRQMFGSLFGRQSRHPSAHPNGADMNDRGRSRGAERDAPHQDRQTQFPQQRRGQGWKGQADFGEAPHRHRRAESMHPGFSTNPFRSRREPSLHPGFDNNPPFQSRREPSLHPGFDNNTSFRSRREPSLHPGFDNNNTFHSRRERSQHPGFGRDRSFHQGFGLDPDGPRTNRHERSNHRQRARTEPGFVRSRHVHFDDESARAHESRFRHRSQAPDLGLDDLNLGEFGNEPQRGPSMGQRHGGPRSDATFGRQLGMRNDDRGSEIDIDLNRIRRERAAGFDPRRQRQAESDPRQAPTPDFRGGGMFGTSSRRSTFGDARSDAGRGRGIMANYDKVKSLAKGGMSTAINVVKSRSSGRLFVQKCVEVRQPTQMKRFCAELDTLLRIKQSGISTNLNILAEFQASNHSPEAIVILEYCDMGSLEGLIKSYISKGRCSPEAMAWNVLLGVGKALAFLHHGDSGQGRDPTWDMTFHLDLKPCNIFLSSTGGRYGFPRVVLADFGCSVKISQVVRGEEHLFFQMCGSSDWFPPEGVGQTPLPHYGVKTDIWQLGATIHALCLGIYAKPNRMVLCTAAPCGRYYSAMLNRSVAHLTHYNSQVRPEPRAIIAAASIGFREAAMAG